MEGGEFPFLPCFQPAGVRCWTEWRPWHRGAEKRPRTPSFFDASQTERSLVCGGYEAARGFFIAPWGKRNKIKERGEDGDKK